MLVFLSDTNCYNALVQINGVQILALLCKAMARQTLYTVVSSHTPIVHFRTLQSRLGTLKMLSRASASKVSYSPTFRAYKSHTDLCAIPVFPCNDSTHFPLQYLCRWVLNARSRSQHLVSSTRVLSISATSELIKAIQINACWCGAKCNRNSLLIMFSLVCIN